MMNHTLSITNFSHNKNRKVAVLITFTRCNLKEKLKKYLTKSRVSLIWLDKWSVFSNKTVTVICN